MSRPYAADDFPAIRARLAELRAAREPVAVADLLAIAAAMQEAMSSWPERRAVMLAKLRQACAAQRLRVDVG